MVHVALSACDAVLHIQFSVLAGASMITAETGCLLSALLAEREESLQTKSVSLAQISGLNTDVWMKVQQIAHVTVVSYEGSTVSTHKRQVPAYHWDQGYEGNQADRYLPYIHQNIKIDSRCRLWVNASRTPDLLTQPSALSLGYNFRGTADVALCSGNAVRSNVYT